MNKQELIKRYEVELKDRNPFSETVSHSLMVSRFLDDLKQLDEPQKPVVPQFVADWYEKHKYDLEYDIWEYILHWGKQQKSEFYEWMNHANNKPFQTLVNMHRFGYTVEKEKQYEVILCNGQSLKTVYRQGGDRLDFEKVYGNLERFTRKQLEDAGFGWVFNCEGIVVREAE